MIPAPAKTAVPLAHRLPAGTLLADIGGTNARFLSISDDGQPLPPQILAARSHVSLESALQSYLDSFGAPMPRRAAIAVACPVAGDTVTFTNLDWRFSITRLRDAFGFETLTIVNDAAAIACALPWLANGDLDIWQSGAPSVSPFPMVMIAPGTGLGIAGLVRGESRWIAVAGEGGHATLAARNDSETAVIARLSERFGHVSAERAVSGPGIANIHAALLAIDGVKDAPLSPEDLTERLRNGSDPRVHRTFGLFADLLGTVAANAVLTFGATGGVYLAGGILPALGVDFDRQRFLTRFVDKGRFGALLETVPVALIRTPFPAFVGLAAILSGAATGTVATG